MNGGVLKFSDQMSLIDIANSPNKMTSSNETCHSFERHLNSILLTEDIVELRKESDGSDEHTKDAEKLESCKNVLALDSNIFQENDEIFNHGHKVSPREMKIWPDPQIEFRIEGSGFLKIQPEIKSKYRDIDYAEAKFADESLENLSSGIGEKSIISLYESKSFHKVDDTDYVTSNPKHKMPLMEKFPLSSFSAELVGLEFDQTLSAQLDYRSRSIWHAKVSNDEFFDAHRQNSSSEISVEKLPKIMSVADRLSPLDPLRNKIRTESELDSWKGLFEYRGSGSKSVYVTNLKHLDREVIDERGFLISDVNREKIYTSLIEYVNKISTSEEVHFKNRSAQGVFSRSSMIFDQTNSENQRISGGFLQEKVMDLLPKVSIHSHEDSMDLRFVSGSKELSEALSRHQLELRAAFKNLGIENIDLTFTEEFPDQRRSQTKHCSLEKDISIEGIELSEGVEITYNPSGLDRRI
ncbi:hypothetical protein [Marivita sp. XM-24bin2]|jgi:hypothetical protein|uniref:hypothetical protein n=1 Tax=unclassified Marivita TaxID=2632480 RepID=UPI000D7AFCD6|nr:hypothetical protein [Marivita sp. XM-24bin2]MCR9109665.1 flagellar hook-length control protein FliK [Paracoccaceae bacterium]PWL34985.1 MAG: hypothetical protein DCO97_11455 [Marivita sp. XM-24bin2]